MWGCTQKNWKLPLVWFLGWWFLEWLEEQKHNAVFPGSLASLITSFWLWFWFHWVYCSLASITSKINLKTGTVGGLDGRLLPISRPIKYKYLWSYSGIHNPIFLMFRKECISFPPSITEEKQVYLLLWSDCHDYYMFSLHVDIQQRWERRK